jgi:hypothetical protein
MWKIAVDASGLNPSFWLMKIARIAVEVPHDSSGLTICFLLTHDSIGAKTLKEHARENERNRFRHFSQLIFSFT